jgi:hypothetical protein
MKEAQTPICKRGTRLSIGKVHAIKNDHVEIATPRGVVSFSFSEIEELIDAE